MGRTVELQNKKRSTLEMLRNAMSRAVDCALCPKRRGDSSSPPCAVPLHRCPRREAPLLSGSARAVLLGLVRPSLPARAPLSLFFRAPSAASSAVASSASAHRPARTSCRACERSARRRHTSPAHPATHRDSSGARVSACLRSAFPHLLERATRTQTPTRPGRSLRASHRFVPSA